MKKYQKPHIIIEHFTLMEHIAANCIPGFDEEQAVGYRNRKDCGFRFDADNILFYNSNCNVSEEFMPFYEDELINYHGPGATLDNLFVS